jgi:hypothetical protein
MNRKADGSSHLFISIENALVEVNARNGQLMVKNWVNPQNRPILVAI